jgi:hypothetical protein
MRTTLTLDPDVAQKLKARTLEQQTTFKQVVNEAIRRGLKAPDRARKPYRVTSYSMGLRPGIDPDKLNQLAGELETQEFARKARRAAKRGRR